MFSIDIFNIIVDRYSRYFFLRDRNNNSKYLENSFGNFDRVLPIFNEEKIQEKIGGMLF